MSWYKEMAGRAWEMCHSDRGPVFNRELKSWTAQYSHSLCVSCQCFLDPLPCYRFISPPAKLDKSSQQVLQCSFPGFRKELSDRKEDISALPLLAVQGLTGIKRYNLRLLLSKGSRGVRAPSGVLALTDVHFKALKPFTTLTVPTEDKTRAAERQGPRSGLQARLD